MKTLALILLAATLAACHRANNAPHAPTAEELGAELAKYPQVLLILSPETAENMRRAAEFRGTRDISPSDFQPVYEHETAIISGSTVSVLAAVSGAWLLPPALAARPVSPPQFLRALGEDPVCRFAILTTPKGSLIVAKEQVLDALIAAKNAGAAVEDVPFTIIRGAAPARQ